MRVPYRLTPLSTITLAAVTFVLSAGCGYSGGEALFMTGLFKRPTVEASFMFSEGPVAVLVDDFQEHCYWPNATQVLAQEVVKELREKKVAHHLIPASHVQQVRQSVADFDDKSAAAVGKLVKAEQVLMLGVRSFEATETPTKAGAAARMGVAAKVINVLEEKDRSKVRLWPKSHDGEIIEADIPAAVVTRAKTRDEILRKLTEALAERIAQRFHDRPLGDFE